MTKLLALDLDGTLTQHKSSMEPEHRAALDKLSEKYELVMVCAGGCERVYKQMERYPIDIIGYYGMQTSAVTDGELKILSNYTENTNRDITLTRAEKIRTEFGLTEFSGETIEIHASGMLTFPVLGTAAPPDKKLSYDPDRQKRRQMYPKICEIFNDFNVFIGGSSSFDIVPKPYCKLYALEKYMKENNIAQSDVIYIGDDYGPDGNDSDIYNSNITFICIDKYKDFPDIAGGLL